MMTECGEVTGRAYHFLVVATDREGCFGVVLRCDCLLRPSWLSRTRPWWERRGGEVDGAEFGLVVSA
jgi:hypothetical protein